MPFDFSHEARELFAATTNGGPVCARLQADARGAMLSKSRATGTAARWAVLAQEAAREYVREFCGPHHSVTDMFSEADVLQTAVLLQAYYAAQNSTVKVSA
jgi:hypothetical protein